MGKEQIQEMESELERFHKQNTQLELNITELRQKLKATDKEMHQERQRVRDVEAIVRRFKTDLHNCVGYIQDPKLLKESIRALYTKHVQENIWRDQWRHSARNFPKTQKSIEQITFESCRRM